MVTIYHWDLPQSLHEAGGWPNPLIVNWYADYAKVCFQLFGDDVKYWLTFNEPNQICQFGYGSGLLAPAYAVPQAEFLCAHNVIRAHSKAWYIYENEFRASQKGELIRSTSCPI